jgi:uncharacterized membrane protein YphA (DoxX/SURF4 family)
LDRRLRRPGLTHRRHRAHLATTGHRSRAGRHEVLGGAALILGLFTPVVAALNTLNLLGALVLVHAGNGYELVLALALGC